jgi:CheY-like chemotaxis protein
MPKILIIEDEVSILDLLSEVLGYENYEVVCAQTGEAGIKQAGAEKPDVILCDISLGGMDGHAVLKALRADEATQTIPIIFMTGQMAPQEVESGISDGADDHLCKPVARKEILAAISRQLQKRAGGK